MSELLVYVCDRCANLFHAHDATECPVCHSQALWEYAEANERNARQHAFDIRTAPTSQGRRFAS